ncbi:MAG: DNA polymerase III subunit delta [Candidatus Promineifilaceae bacterium]|jgi:DNA polymerase-3 subunit delta
MFYIFHGEDDLTKTEKLASLLTRHGDMAMLELNTTRFNGQVPIATLRQAAETVPFISPIRIVLVNNLFSTNPGKEYMKELQTFLPKLPATARLIFLESQTLKKNHPILMLAEQSDNGRVLFFPLPEGGQLIRWIQQQAEKDGGEISPRAANLLASLVGNDLRTLENEIQKLVAYKEYSHPKTIEPDDIDLLSPYVAEASIFNLVDALGNRNEQMASTLYQQKLDEGADPFYLFSMFVRQFRLLIQVKELAAEDYAPHSIAQEVGIHDFVAGKLNQQAQGFSIEELEQIYRHLMDIDVAVKIGEADIRTALDLLIAQLTIAP